MKSHRVGLILFVVLVLAFSAASCNLPFKLVSNVQSTTPPPISADTPAPVEASTDEPASAGGTTFADVLPVTGSILRWIDQSDFVYVPAGEFVMGQDENTPVDYMPAHTVSLAGFWIQQAEVTNQQYAACVSAGACTSPAQEEDTPYWYSQSDRVNDPVVGVTWSQAAEYCEYIDSRLPTEAEWEYAARGTQDTTYPWGEDEPACSLLNFDDCLDPSEPEEVRQYSSGASEFEALDMAGNVFEWVFDWYAEDYYVETQVSNPVGPVDGTQKVYRGSAYDSKKDEVSSFVRFSEDPNSHAANLGFRCVLLGDYSAEGSTMQVPRSCSVLPIAVTQPKEGPTITPIPCEPPEITVTCSLNSKGVAVTRMNIIQSGCGRNGLNGLPAIGGSDMSCFDFFIDSSTSNNVYTCIHPNLVQGATVNVNYCQKVELSEFETICPAGYEFSPSNSFCEPVGEWIGEPPCPTYYEEINGMCFPDPQIYTGCPEGFFFKPVNYNGSLRNTCIPLDMQCLYAYSNTVCNKPVCPEGESYDQAKNCCSSPEKLTAICQLGYSTYEDPNTHKITCRSGGIFESTCGSVSIKVPYCPILTPTVTVTPPSPSSPSSSCSKYNNQPDNCAANDCSYNDTTGECY